MKMQSMLKNTIRLTLIAVTVFSVLTLNLSGLLSCTSLTMSYDCCHITKIVKPCCVKNLKITFKERISGHCGCTMDESQQAADLYNDINSSGVKHISRDFSNSSITMSPWQTESSGCYATEYTPPPNYRGEIYLTNSVLRI